MTKTTTLSLALQEAVSAAIVPILEVKHAQADLENARAEADKAPVRTPILRAIAGQLDLYWPPVFADVSNNAWDGVAVIKPVSTAMTPPIVDKDKIKALFTAIAEYGEGLGATESSVRGILGRYRKFAIKCGLWRHADEERDDLAMAIEAIDDRFTQLKSRKGKTRERQTRDDLTIMAWAAYLNPSIEQCLTWRDEDLKALAAKTEAEQAEALRKRDNALLDQGRTEAQQALLASLPGDLAAQVLAAMAGETGEGDNAPASRRRR
jgi:hypothetical protein